MIQIYSINSLTRPLPASFLHFISHTSSTSSIASYGQPINLTLYNIGISNKSSPIHETSSYEILSSFI